MSKKNENNKQVTTVHSTSKSGRSQDPPTNETETSYKLGRLIAKWFKVDPKTASLISKTILSISGSVVSIVTVVLSLLKGLGVI